MEYTIYFAGELFDHKHLIGNALLAAHIERLSNGRYRCVLPQDLEQTDSRAVDIRNQDLIGVATCDMALFNFDGSDLDSGTVVEFVYAKLLDIPAVILRTDFRGGGDQDTDGDAWNLMASFYPAHPQCNAERDGVVSGGAPRIGHGCGCRIALLRQDCAGRSGCAGCGESGIAAAWRCT